MKILILLFLAALFSSCSGSGHDTVELDISYTLENGETCKTYLADHFLVTVYDDEQRKVIEKQIKCDSSDSDKITLFVEKGLYYISVFLRIPSENKKDWIRKFYGATKVSVIKDSEEPVKVAIKMREYSAGIEFKWDSADCGKYDISLMTFNLTSEGKHVEADEWGEKIEIKDYPVPCSDGRFKVIDISSDPFYFAEMNGFRRQGDKEIRIKYENPKLKVTDYTDTPVEIDDKEYTILVSDMKVSWEFDSKSIDSCGTAGIEKVELSVSGSGFQAKQEQKCDDRFSDFYIYNLSEGSYELHLSGISPSGETIFESLETSEIEPGHIGEDILKKQIFLKEK